MTRTLPLTLIPALALAACGEADSGTDLREVGAYEAATVTGAREVTLAGSAEIAPGTVLLECPDGSRDVDVEVIDSRLSVYAPGAERDCHVWLNGPDLAAVALEQGQSDDDHVALHLDGDGELVLDELIAGEVDVYVRGGATIEIADLQADDVDVDLSGGGSLWLGTVTGGHLAVVTRGNSDVMVDSLAVDHWGLDTAGSTTLTAAGDAGEADIIATGSASIAAMDVTAEVATIETGGSALVELTVTDEVVVDAGGSSTVDIGGTPLQSTVDVAAGAEVIGL